MNDFLSTYWLDILGTITGLVYIYQEYKASISLWITGIIMPVIYMFVYFDAGLYADFGMQIYYVLAAVYGFVLWRWGDYLQPVVCNIKRTCRIDRSSKSRTTENGNAETVKDDTEVLISHFPKRYILRSTLVFFVLWLTIYEILIHYTNSTVPVLDSFGNSLSFIGLWALSHKYIEQWWIWIIVDVELAALYVYKNLPFTAGLYAIYVIIAVAGFYKWKRMMKEQAKEQNNKN